MRTFLWLALCCTGCALTTAAQDYRPIQLWGYNHDVIAEGPGRDAAALTTKEMDARFPSNFVLFSKKFAEAIGMDRSYGLPDDGKIVSGTRSFQLKDFNGTNAVYLLKGDRRVVSFVRPLAYDGLSILGLATEGQASLNLIIYFIDGTSLRTGPIVFEDWFNGPDALLMGFGRVKREADSKEKPLYYEGAPSNPRLYAVDVFPPANKVIQSIEFRNSSAGEAKDSHRAFIFAISGYSKFREVEIAPLVTEQKKTVKDSVPAEIPFLHGTVTDAITNKPLEAAVAFTYQDNGSTAYTVEGVYRLFKVHQLTLFDKKEYSIKVTSPGYLDINQKITAALWPTRNELNFVLQPIEVGTVVKLKGVLFTQSTAVLVAESYPVLNDMAEFMAANPKVRIELAGHTDNRGSQKANLKLSEDRVAAVKKYLVSKGVDAGRITGKGYGGSKPITKNDSEEARRLNRRVEFVITEK